MERERLYTLRDELLRMAEKDQAMRDKSLSGEAAWDGEVDDANMSRLKEIIDQYGWPTIAAVGVEASQAAWLIAQHAPDIVFMEECLAIMKKLPEGAIDPANTAYLEDRVLILIGELQIYGTQFYGEGEDVYAFPVYDPENLDTLRAQVGLETFADAITHLHNTNNRS